MHAHADMLLCEAGCVAAAEPLSQGQKLLLSRQQAGAHNSLRPLNKRVCKTGMNGLHSPSIGLALLQTG